MNLVIETHFSLIALCNETEFIHNTENDCLYFGNLWTTQQIANTGVLEIVVAQSR